MPASFMKVAYVVEAYETFIVDENCRVAAPGGVGVGVFAAFRSSVDTIRRKRKSAARRIIFRAVRACCRDARALACHPGAF